MNRIRHDCLWEELLILYLYPLVWLETWSFMWWIPLISHLVLAHKVVEPRDNVTMVWIFILIHGIHKLSNHILSSCMTQTQSSNFEFEFSRAIEKEPNPFRCFLKFQIFPNHKQSNTSSSKPKIWGASVFEAS